MEFEWDENKRRSNLQKHKIDFLKACRIFDSSTVDYQDLRYDYGEDRFIAIGKAESQILTVTYTYRGETIRLIGARKATKDERRIYDENFT